MTRPPLDPRAFVKAWESQNWNNLHDTAMKESSRQVNEMVKWMDWQIRFDPDEMKEIHAGGVFEMIRKARRYRDRIYNRRRARAEIEFKRISAIHSGDKSALSKINDTIAELEDDQWVAFRRITKIYFAVKYAAGGALLLTEPEELDYEYDPEDA